MVRFLVASCSQHDQAYTWLCPQVHSVLAIQTARNGRRSVVEQIIVQKAVSRAKLLLI